MIISASRRTDIPAFFGPWFLERLQEGWVEVANPYNAHQIKRVELDPNQLDAFVFWTKNPRPFFPVLNRLDNMGYRYYFQYTLTGYDSRFEPHLDSIEHRLEAFVDLATMLGAKRVVWRYDPIILSTITPLTYHLDRFSELCEQLSSATERVMISPVHYYRKTLRRLKKLANQGIRFDRDFAQNNQSFFRNLGAISNSHQMQMASCASEVNLKPLGIEAGACIDAALINSLWNLSTSTTKDTGQRPFCRCAQSQDIGTNNTCQHGCLYCYANR